MVKDALPSYSVSKYTERKTIEAYPKKLFQQLIHFKLFSWLRDVTVTGEMQSSPDYMKCKSFQRKKKKIDN